MTPVPERVIEYDRHLGSYGSFFDHAWATDLMGRTETSVLKDPVFSLLMNWKAAANTHMMPWLLIEQLKSFAQSYARTCQTASEYSLARIAKHIPAAMGDSLSNMKRKKLQQVITDLGHGLGQARQEHTDDTDPQALFDSYLTGPGGHELQLSLWGTQRVVYGAIYHAYENFATRCVGLTRGDPHYRPGNGKELVAAAKAAFDAITFGFCITDDSVSLARLVRNAIAHHGGMETEELRKVSHGIAVREGELQLMPSDSRSLFTALKDRASALAKTTMAITSGQS